MSKNLINIHVCQDSVHCLTHFDKFFFQCHWKSENETWLSGVQWVSQWGLFEELTTY